MIRPQYRDIRYDTIYRAIATCNSKINNILYCNKVFCLSYCLGAKKRVSVCLLLLLFG